MKNLKMILWVQYFALMYMMPLTSASAINLIVTSDMHEFRLEEKGKDYAAKVLLAFPYLKQYRAGPNNSTVDKLMGAIASDHLVDAIDFIPMSLLSLFQELQNLPAQ